MKFLNLNNNNNKNNKISIFFNKMLNQIKKSKKIFNLINNFTVNQTRKVTTNESLVNYLKMKINMKGPITVQEYIKECLGHPKYVILLFFFCFLISF